MELIISGYGSKPQTSIALYRYETDRFIPTGWQDSIEAPSFVCLGNGYLFTITEAEEYAVVFAYKRVGDQYRQTDYRRIEGGALCHITYSVKNNALFGACYGTGTIFSIRVTDGMFGELLYHEKQLGADEKAVTRAHCVLLNQEESMLVVTNIALDKLYCYNVDDGRLGLIKEVDMPTGVGPRHALLAQDEKLLYIITEYSNEIFVFQNNHEMNLLQRISTLSEDFTDVSNCSTMCLSRNGRFLYAANRGADTITLFTVNNGGILHRIKEYSCGGKHPRHMIISEEGDLLIVCNQYSNLVSVFELDQNNGTITAMKATTVFASPSGVIEVQ